MEESRMEVERVGQSGGSGGNIEEGKIEDGKGRRAV